MIKGNDDTRFGRRLESLFWWLLRLAPLIVFVLISYGFSRVDSSYYISLDGVINTYFCELSDSNVVVSTFIRVFYDVLGFFPSEDIGVIYYFTYLVYIELGRFFINFFLFIIRLANNFFDRFGR